MANTPSPRVLIVGWDGATFDLIHPWVEAGHLPNTAKLLAEGAQRVLHSTIPTLSPPAWTSFVTGKNPGRHGIFDFVRRRPDSYDLQSVRAHLPSLGTLFRRVSEGGRRVGVLNVPLTYPPEPVNGFMVSGLGAAPEWAFTYPSELRHELLAMGYAIDNPVVYDGTNDAAYLDAALATTRKRAEVALHLMEAQVWDLFMVVFMNVDQLLTFLWHHMDPTHPRHDPALAHLGDGILDLHRILDAALGEMMAVAGEETTVVLASDHGMGPLYKEVFLNHWLREQGVLALRESAARRGYQTLARRLHFTRQDIWRAIGPARTQQFKRLLPQRLHALVPEEHPALADQIDWSRTRAYSFGNVGQIYVNLAGREPQGIVQPGIEYDALIAELTAALQTMTDPATGERVVDAVYHKSALYDGPFYPLAPDLNVIMKDYSYVTQMRRELAHEATFAPCASMSGFHRREGIFVARGPNVAPGRYAPASITGVTPTVLYLMGLLIPSDMDGQVMEEMCRPTFRQRARPQRVDVGGATPVEAAPLTDEEEAAMLERLKELGYLG